MKKNATKDEVAKHLAKRHYELEDGLTQIFRITAAADAEASPAEPIKLLTVNADTVSAGVLPLHFEPAPASGIPFPSVVVEVTPEEFAQIRAKKLRLPNGWMIGKALPKPAK